MAIEKEMERILEIKRTASIELVNVKHSKEIMEIYGDTNDEHYRWLVQRVNQLVAVVKASDIILRDMVLGKI